MKPLVEDQMKPGEEEEEEQEEEEEERTEVNLLEVKLRVVSVTPSSPGRGQTDSLLLNEGGSEFSDNRSEVKLDFFVVLF